MRRVGLMVLALALAAGSAAEAAEICAPPAGLELSDADRARLDGVEASRTAGLAAALLGEVAEDRRIVSELFGAGPAGLDADGLAGTYECRTIKLGGLLPLTAYGWFRCEIAADGDELQLRKVTGSQNFSGTLHQGGDGRFVYRGAGHYSDESPLRYGDDPERDQVGCLSGIAGRPGHLLLELPSPHLESLHDVIELVPAD